MAVSKVVENIMWYWWHMQRYHDNASMLGRQYYLDTQLRPFLLEVTHPRVQKLLEEFIKVKDVHNDGQ